MNGCCHQMEFSLVAAVVALVSWVSVWADDSKVISDRYAVYWNSTNP
ncbi:ephrin-A2, partial [Arapaima gigas]